MTGILLSKIYFGKCHEVQHNIKMKIKIIIKKVLRVIYNKQSDFYGRLHKKKLYFSLKMTFNEESQE